MRLCLQCCGIQAYELRKLGLKALSHEAIFPATCNAVMSRALRDKLTRILAYFSCNSQCNFSLQDRNFVLDLSCKGVALQVAEKLPGLTARSLRKGV